VSDHHGTNATNSDIENSPISSTTLMRMPFISTTTLLLLLLSQSLMFDRDLF